MNMPMAFIIPVPHTMMTPTNIAKPESFMLFSFLLLLGRISYTGNRMKLQMHFPISKREIAETLSSSFNGSIFPSHKELCVCFSSKASFNLILRALKKLRNKTSVPQLDVYIKTIEQHLAISVSSERAHRAAVRKSSSVVTLKELVPDERERSTLPMLIPVT